MTAAPRKGKSRAQKRQIGGLAELRKAKEARSKAVKLPLGSPRGKMSVQFAKQTISKLREIVETQTANLEMLRKQLEMKTAAFTALKVRLNISEEQIARLKQTLCVER